MLSIALKCNTSPSFKFLRSADTIFDTNNNKKKPRESGKISSRYTVCTMVRKNNHYGSLQSWRETAVSRTQKVGTARVYRSRPSWPIGPPEVGRQRPATCGYGEHSLSMIPDTGAEKFESIERINSMRKTNGSFDSCNSCKRLVPSRLHKLHESKLPFVSRIEIIRSVQNSRFFLLMYPGTIG